MTVHAPAQVSRVLYPMTDARTGGGHLMIEKAAIVGRLVGRYLTVCGVEVLAASLTTPESGYCRSCVRWAAR